MMKQMRENTKWIMLITAAAFVGLMVFEWGMDLSGGSAAQFTGGEVGSVNGRAIMYQEFMEVRGRLYEQRQQQGGSIGQAEDREIENEAWDQIVMDRLIADELSRRGISVRDAEIRQAARFAPPPEFYQYEMFQTEGQFDLSKYHQFLASSASDQQLLRDLEAYYRRVLPRTKLFQQVGGTIVVTDGELWQMYRERNETATVRFIGLDPQALVSDDEAAVTEREVSTYYNANRSSFERPARAEVRFVSLDKRPTAADTAASRERAAEIRQMIVDGLDFAEIAREESTDQGSAGAGGDLGTIQRGQTVAPFEEAVWSAPLNQLTEPVRTQFGYHIIRVTRRTEEEADAAHILVPIERTIESEDALLGRVDSLEVLVDRLPLAAAAEQFGLTVRTSEITPVLPNIPGIGSVVEATDWIFRERPQPGDVSEVFENEQRFYVMELIEREDARPLTLDEARPSIRQVLAAQRKRERTRDIGRQIVDRIAAGADLDAAAEPTGIPVREAGPFTRLDFVPGIGSANAAVGAAFGLGVGQTSGLIETPDAFYIIRVTDREEADRQAWEEQKQLQRQQVMQALQNQRINDFMEALRETARIVDNRDAVLRAPEEPQRPQMPTMF